MNQPKFTLGHKVKVRMVVDGATHPGKHPDAKIKGQVGTVKGYGGWNNGGSAANGGNVNHEYVIGLEGGPVAVISESWLEPA